MILNRLWYWRNNDFFTRRSDAVAVIQAAIRIQMSVKLHANGLFHPFSLVGLG